MLSLHSAKLVVTFLPTPSARRATSRLRTVRPRPGFLPTPSARRATVSALETALTGGISTHALREEGDSLVSSHGSASHISTHALREEGDTGGEYTYTDPTTISTHALREEGDLSGRRSIRSCCYFYPRPPRGGRPAKLLAGLNKRQISTHALREEGDLPPKLAQKTIQRFLPTPSARRATFLRRFLS